LRTLEIYENSNNMSKDTRNSILLWAVAIVVVVVVAIDLLPDFEFPAWVLPVAFAVMAIDVIRGLVIRSRRNRADP
jgi:uncharacterized membrane protein